MQLQLQRDYELLAAKGTPPDVIYQTLLNYVNFNLSFPQSSLYDLSPEDQFKVYTLLSTLFRACPLYLNSQRNRPQITFVYTYTAVPAEEFPRYRDHCYCPVEDAIFTWFMLDILLHNSAYHSGWGGSRYHTTSSDKGGESWAIWLLVILAVLAIAAAFVAMYYLFSQFLDDMERFWHNEGWMQAAISILATAASGCAAGLLTSVFLSAPLISLAIAAGVSNPAGIVILAVICLSLLGAWLGGFITNKIQEYAIRMANPEAMDVYDAHRYRLTESERSNLVEKGLDPEKVLTAMVAIRQVMGKEQLPSLLNRIFTAKGAEKQELLNKIRQLRKGEINDYIQVEVPANEATGASAYILQFDLRAFQLHYVPPVINVSQLPTFDTQTPFYNSEGYQHPPASIYSQQPGDYPEPAVMHGNHPTAPQFSYNPAWDPGQYSFAETQQFYLGPQGPGATAVPQQGIYPPPPPPPGYNPTTNHW